MLPVSLVAAQSTQEPSPGLPLERRALARMFPARAAFEKMRSLGDVAPYSLNDRAGPSQRLVHGMAAPRVLPCSGALANGVVPDASVHLDCLTFGSGERFVVIKGDVLAAAVAIAQGFDADDPGICNAVVEMLQAVWAARSAQCAQHIVLYLPSFCDPQLACTAFNRLLPKLAKASGAAEIRYAQQLGQQTGQHSAPDALAKDIEERAAQLRCADSRQGADSIYRLAQTQAKQAGRRGHAGPEKAWRLLAFSALRMSGALAPAEAQPVTIFGAAASHALRDAIAAAKQKEGPARIGRHTMDAGMPHITLQTPVEGADVVVVQGMRPAPGPGAQDPFKGCASLTIEALLLVQAARESGARRITVVQAYQMNGRSDIEEHGLTHDHAGAYAPLVAQWFDAVKIDAAVLVECHDMHTPTAWSSTHHAHARVVGGARMLLDDLFATMPEKDREHTILAIPDAGGAKRLKPLRGLFNRTLEGRKLRREHNSEAVLQSLGDGALAPETSVVLIDDEAAGGATLAQSLRMLHEQGARTIHALIVHDNLSLDVVERNLLLAWFRSSGATSLRFSNTHAMGPVAQRYEDLLTMGGDPDEVASRVKSFMQNKNIAMSPECFISDLKSFVHVVCCAENIAKHITA